MSNKLLEEKFSHLRKGYTCPECHRWAKMYRVRISSTMVQRLITCYDLNVVRNYEWVTLEQICFSGKFLTTNTGGLPTLRHWGLVRARAHNPVEKVEDSGWQITEEGIEFLTGSRTVPKYAYLYNNTCYGHSDVMVTAEQALARKFSLPDILKR